MKKIFIFLMFLMGVMLFGANLINVNFFPEKNKIDILLSLDDKFNGKVLKTDKNTYLITNIVSDKKIEKSFENYFLKKIVINPDNNAISIKIFTKAKYNTSVALTPDGYGLRFRINNIAPINQVLNITKTNPENKLDYFTYVLSLIILLLIAVGLFIFKKKFVKKFPSTTLNVNILFQKPIDAKNKIALIEFNKRKYLVLIGNSNILLDIFDENMINISSQEQFNAIFEQTQKIDNLKQYIQNAEKLKEFDEKI